MSWSLVSSASSLCLNAQGRKGKLLIREYHGYALNISIGQILFFAFSWHMPYAQAHSHRTIYPVSHLARFISWYPVSFVELGILIAVSRLFGGGWRPLTCMQSVVSPKSFISIALYMISPKCTTLWLSNPLLALISIITVVSLNALLASLNTREKLRDQAQSQTRILQDLIELQINQNAERPDYPGALSYNWIVFLERSNCNLAWTSQRKAIVDWAHISVSMSLGVKPLCCTLR